MTTSHYFVNKRTIAILPNTHTEFLSRVIELEKEILVAQPPLEIIKQSCLQDFSSYEGRKNAIIFHTGFKKKTPIPISPSKGIYAFPTHSPKDYECNWIFYKHVKQIKTNPSQKTTHSIISFSNSQQLSLNVTYHTLKLQMQRTGFCNHKINNKNRQFFSNFYEFI